MEMNKRNKLILAISVIVALVMVLSAFSVMAVQSTNTQQSISPNSSAASISAFQTPPAHLSARATGVMAQLASRGIPAKYVYLPNFNEHANKIGNLIGPSYTSAPAPMGIGAYGLMYNGTNYTGFNLTTSSFMGEINMSNLQDLYALDDGPTSVTIQLNAVLDNVALFGNSSYAFWTQNVMFYSARTHTLEFLDNLWNFSSPSFTLTQNSLYSYDGTPVAPVYYYDVGPNFTVTYPFQVKMFLNATVIGGRSTVFYNYSLTDNGLTKSGSYDEIQFNSTPSSNPSYVAPKPTYLISGNTLTPTGFIPYDAEIMIGGPGGGSNANVYAIDATMQLQYLNHSAYQSVPSAFDVGSETGETSQGVAVSWTPNHVAHLTAGPSYVYGMWNASSVSTMRTYSGIVTPSNSFVFVSPGVSFNNTTAAWIPIGMDGHYHFTLPAGNYSAVAMLSDHNPMYFNPRSGDVSLALNASQGLYTPLYAMSVDQLQNISTEGSGMYTIYNNYSPGINPLFGEVNDYMFPAFVGVMIADLNAPITIQNMPYLNVTFQGNNALVAVFYSVPLSDQMSYVIYNSSEVTVKDNTFTGWFSSNLDEFPVANLLLWNSTNINVTSNIFITMDSSMLIYNVHSVNANNMVSGNFFIQSSALNRYNYAPIAISTSLGTLSPAPTGLTVYSSGNTIFGNAFAVYLTAISLNYSIYSGYYVVYKDSWNMSISGYNAGNYWWNYHPYAHDFAYNNYGLITSGYDFHPHKLPGFGALVHDFERA